MNRLLRLAVAAPILLAGCAETPTAPYDPPSAPGPAAHSALALTFNERLPLALVQFVQCADGGAGEDVHVEGTLHVLNRLTIDGNGGFHLRTHVHPQGARGVGQTTGDVYRATGRTGGTLYEASGGLPTVETTGNTFRLTAPGKGNDLAIHANVHITVDANGGVRAEVSNERMECR